MTADAGECHPTLENLDDARAAFGTHESRDVFYRAATDLVDFALRRMASVSVSEAVAVLLQTWNRSYYRYHPATARHYEDLEAVLTQHRAWLAGIRARSIDTFRPSDEAPLVTVFDDFEAVLGPVGRPRRFISLRPISCPYGIGRSLTPIGCAFARWAPTGSAM
jgi:hypothetical protein